jgi:hypothetical protein
MVPPSGFTTELGPRAGAGAGGVGAAGDGAGAPKFGLADCAVVANAGCCGATGATGAACATGAGGTGIGANCAPIGGVFAPRAGGATPIIVPFSFGFGATGAGAAAGAATGGATGAAAGGATGAEGFGAPAGRGTLGGAFIINIVPLNFGAAAAAFNANPHFAHAVAVS